MVRFLSYVFLFLLMATAGGCGGGGGGSALDPQVLAEGISTEEVLPEDQGSGDRNLIPPNFVVVVPGPGSGGQGADWVMWPESLATHVLDANNLYAHSDQALSWPANGVGIYSSRADCSGYVTRSLLKAFDLTTDNMKAWMGSTGPSSARYHDNIVFKNNFQQIEIASDIRRGDIVAIKYLDKTSGGTGHTMIAASAPVLRTTPTKPLIAGTNQFELRIIDSTSSPHGTGDTRKGTAADGSDQNGAGLGTMRIYADATSGLITGYTWSLSTGSSYYTANSPAEDRRSLVVGRMTFAD
ncbi:hypothetical protein EZ313_14755 [Ramlibacter henchirensis]|uniref:Uncharacterized protein n=1 Tax=Ramlibacter henchirensis TaxID=204072 RepID=A0A4Z0BW88_9BURK|nr:hypothetical protein [Ramlibacter henchirensis]TFZ02518.1 hypothetical protein EZ313_14755 [Ramlibacter henchirensis]